MSDEQKTDQGAELIHQAIPESAETEPRPVCAERITEVITQLDVAHQIVCEAIRRQFDGKPAFQFSIPANPNRDTDLIVTDAILSAIGTLSGIRSLGYHGTQLLREADAARMTMIEIARCPRCESCAKSAEYHLHDFPARTSEAPHSPDSLTTELLEALKECSFRLAAVVAASGDFSEINARCLDRASAAIAKAEGHE